MGWNLQGGGGELELGLKLLLARFVPVDSHWHSSHDRHSLRSRLLLLPLVPLVQLAAIGIPAMIITLFASFPHP